MELVSGSYENGILSCTFNRKKTAALADAARGRKKREATDETTFFDLNKKYILLVAQGTASSGKYMSVSPFPWL